MMKHYTLRFVYPIKASFFLLSCKTFIIIQLFKNKLLSMVNISIFLISFLARVSISSTTRCKIVVIIFI